MSELFEFVHDDGGREFAGYKGLADDCVVRAIAIATGQDYETVYQDMWEVVRKRRAAKVKGADKESPRKGVSRPVYEQYLAERGWEWVGKMKVGQKERTHVRRDELPDETLILRLSGHVTCVRKGQVRDTYDPSRNGTRLVYGYFRKAS